MSLMMNPGVWQVRGNTHECQAARNLRAFRAGNHISTATWVQMPAWDDGDGRYTFLGRPAGTSMCHEIAMPGLPPEQVRDIGNQERDMPTFPRLYINGASFLWPVAAGWLHEPPTVKYPQRAFARYRKRSFALRCARRRASRVAAH